MTAVAPDKQAHVGKILGAYIAFIIAVLFAVAARADDFNAATVICSLLVVSLPSLVALYLLDPIVDAQKRAASASRGVAVFLGFTPSLTALVMVISSFSVIAATLFAVLVIAWSVWIFVVRLIGDENPDSNI